MLFQSEQKEWSAVAVVNVVRMASPYHGRSMRSDEDLGRVYKFTANNLSGGIFDHDLTSLSRIAHNASLKKTEERRRRSAQSLR